MRLPDFITFTGVDDRTDLRDLLDLTMTYGGRVEFGVLMSKSKMGQDPRYPDLRMLRELARAVNLDQSLRLSAHICGQWAREIMRGELPDLPISLGNFRRMQVNHDEPTAVAIRSAANALGVARGIGQTRFGIPWDKSVDWLFDRSGGRGEVPSGYPFRAEINLTGFAGGLTPENVRSQMVLMEMSGALAGPYWLDMESGVRVDNWFSIERVDKVCDEVFSQAWGA